MHKVSRRGFTIVELVIVIAVIGILATVLVPTFGDVIDKAKDSSAKQAAKNAYTEYLIASTGVVDPAACMLYENHSAVAMLQNGALTGIYASRDEAIAALDDPDTATNESARYALFPSGVRNLYLCAEEVSFMHISFDDVALCLKNLSKNNYDSLYDEPFFGWLKDLHDRYGAKFSLYVYPAASNLSNVPDTYAAEFSDASDWLKFGIHAPIDVANFKESDYAHGYAQWASFVAQIQRITGTTNSIDRIPRLHNFAGTKEALLGMRDAECGALGFLAADDSRSSYYLDAQTSAGLFNNDHITDFETGLVFLTTEKRAESLGGDIYSKLESQYASTAYATKIPSYIFFTHEPQVYTNGALRENTQWVEDACRFAYDHSIAFLYPQEVTLSLSNYDIYPAE